MASPLSNTRSINLTHSVLGASALRFQTMIPQTSVTPPSHLPIKLPFVECEGKGLIEVIHPSLPSEQYANILDGYGAYHQKPLQPNNITPSKQDPLGPALPYKLKVGLRFMSDVYQKLSESGDSITTLFDCSRKLGVAFARLSKAKKKLKPSHVYRTISVNEGFRQHSDLRHEVHLRLKRALTHSQKTGHVATDAILNSYSTLSRTPKEKQFFATLAYAVFSGNLSKKNSERIMTHFSHELFSNEDHKSKYTESFLRLTPINDKNIVPIITETDFYLILRRFLPASKITWGKHYENDQEIDFVITLNDQRYIIEIKSSREKITSSQNIRLKAFATKQNARLIIIYLYVIEDHPDARMRSRTTLANFETVKSAKDFIYQADLTQNELT